ncbi:hypothetical protein GCM10019016_136700 [Streptomyces prasinosporus]|uniref:Uncharacterized protein n=1 Tax=Streptomyces prasinosporus TaxID=68256 RepID=A0ABP6UI35_9ACTN
MEMGDDVSSALGVRVERVRLLLLVSAVLLTASATAAAGTRSPSSRSPRRSSPGG